MGDNKKYVLCDNNKNNNITDVAVCSMKHNDAVSNNNNSIIICSIRSKKGDTLRNAP
jgi:hypothetical protein